MKYYLYWLVMFGVSQAYAQPVDEHRDHRHQPDEMVVTGAQIKKRAETAMPVNVLSGEALRENAGKTLGETLNAEVGVTSASFGPGVGQPVIRGQTGNRVRVLQNGIGTLDASLASQDHANAVEAILAKRIEVIRGPATLLYGNGAIGGVVNVIDNRIPETVPEALSGEFELRQNTVDKGRLGAFKMDGGASGDFAWHLNGMFRESENLDIPGFAIDTEALATEEEVENTSGFVANSDTESASVTGGVSWIGARRFFGLAVSRLQNEYGLPPGAHGHEEGEEEEEEEEVIRLDMQQTRVDLKGGAEFDGFFKELRARITVSDYTHKELEGSEIGTVFNNEGWEGRFTLNHADQNPGGQNSSGVLGLQLGERDFSALGEEAFIPEVNIQSSGLFLVETLDLSAWVYEFGLRVDQQSIDPAAGRCDSSETTWSGSASAIWRQRDDVNWLLSLSRSERAASVEESFSNIQLSNCQEPINQDALVLHAATARFEIGNPDLNTEISQNLEIGLRKHAGNVRAEINIFYNKISDYIYLADIAELEEGVLSRYLQEDATFSGFEAEVSLPFDIGSHSHMDLTLFADGVRAELDDSGENVPRIPAMRIGAELGLSRDHWIAKIKVTSVDDQNDNGINETATTGYTRVDLYFDYHMQVYGNELLLFVKGNNLGDEEIRNHVSFLKNFAPEPGRGYELGLRYQF